MARSAPRKGPTIMSPGSYDENIRALNEWQGKKRNTVRMWLSSKFLGKEGWELFMKAYIETRVDYYCRHIESQFDRSLQEALETIPNIEKLWKRSDSGGNDSPIHAHPR